MMSPCSPRPRKRGSAPRNGSKPARTSLRANHILGAPSFSPHRIRGGGKTCSLLVFQLTPSSEFEPADALQGPALFPQDSNRVRKSPREEFLIGPMLVSVRMNLGTSSKLACHSFSDGWKPVFQSNPANVILSTVWGFEPASPAGGRRQRKELASLYAGYVSFLNR